MKFAKAFLPTPIFNHFSLEEFLGCRDGSLSLNPKGRLPFLEMIALEGSLFYLQEKITSYVYRAMTNEYPCPYPLYVDIRSLKLIEKEEERKKQCPSLQKIINSLLLQRGRPYLWGGNLGDPLLYMEQWYPSPLPLSPYETMIKTFHGIDCSGLIYFASNGFTPRNTAQMVNYGRQVSIAKGDLSDWHLQPLDLIIDLGHVAIVIDSSWSIQSKEKTGVFLIRTKDLIDSLLRKKKPKNEWDDSIKESIFIIRRWIEN